MSEKSSSCHQKGILLINLGSPKAPRPLAISRYLREFLSDPFVIDIPVFFRWVLLYFFILPIRSFKTAKLYQRIWDEKRGSPLIYHSEEFTEQLKRKFSESLAVSPGAIKLAMRYGEPSIKSRLLEFKKEEIEEVVLFPLYPQYAESSTRTALNQAYRVNQENRLALSFKEVPAFYNEAGFLDAFTELGRRVLTENSYDHILFSFHGLPERQIKKVDPLKGGHCLSGDQCCEVMSEKNRNCYRAQCFQTARGIADRLSLDLTDYSASFQSRLGRTPWIKPYTDFVIEDLVRSGKKRILVFSPSFVADCLETLDEISIRLNDQFKSMGGEQLDLVPSLNSEDTWVRATKQIIDQKLVPFTL